MPKGVFTRDAYESSRSTHTTKGKSSTFRGEETVRTTGKLDPLVDPAGPVYGLVRPSRMRFEPIAGDLFMVANGAPGTMEYRLDTTGSMGTNVERALSALPQICGLTATIMPGRDPFFCASIFADLEDKFVLCRGQFEVLADRMVNQLTLMHPEGGGKGNNGEDPEYGLFAGAYLTDAYLHRIGLKSMDFTITDEPMHEWLHAHGLKRVFGTDVFDKLKEIGYDFSESNLPSNGEIVQDLLNKAHAFVFLINTERRNLLDQHWQELYGKDRVILLPNIDYVPHAMAAITGLTEGTLDLQSVKDFLIDTEIDKNEAHRLVDSIAHIPLGAQCALPNYSKLPKQGDIFRTKEDLWAMDPADIPTDAIASPIAAETGTSGTVEGGWL